MQSGDNVITVTARDAANNTSTDTVTVTYTPAAGPPPTPILIAPNAATGTQTPTFTWNASSGATRYELYVKDRAHLGRGEGG